MEDQLRDMTKAAGGYLRRLAIWIAIVAGVAAVNAAAAGLAGGDDGSAPLLQTAADTLRGGLFLLPFLSFAAAIRTAGGSGGDGNRHAAAVGLLSVILAGGAFVATAYLPPLVIAAEVPIYAPEAPSSEISAPWTPWRVGALRQIELTRHDLAGTAPTDANAWLRANHLGLAWHLPIARSAMFLVMTLLGLGIAVLAARGRATVSNPRMLVAATLFTFQAFVLETAGGALTIAKNVGPAFGAWLPLVIPLTAILTLTWLGTLPVRPESSTPGLDT